MIERLLRDTKFPLRPLWGKISAQPHTTLRIQFLNRENNNKNNTLPLRKQICLTTVWRCAEISPPGDYSSQVKEIHWGTEVHQRRGDEAVQEWADEIERVVIRELAERIEQFDRNLKHATVLYEHKGEVKLEKDKLLQQQVAINQAHAEELEFEKKLELKQA